MFKKIMRQFNDSTVYKVNIQKSVVFLYASNERLENENLKLYHL